MSGSQAAEPEKAKAKSGKSKLLLIVVAALLLLGGAGAGGFFWWKGQQAEAAPTAHGEDAKAAESEAVSGALPFKPFVVNLADTDASRYLKADIRLVVSGAENLKELEEDEVTMLRLRSVILEYLSQQTSQALVTPEGKDALKKAIAERCTPILGHAKVRDVLFAEFVVQF